MLPDGFKTIGDYCFSGATNLESVSIPESVSKIGRYAFGNTKLYIDQVKPTGGSFIYADTWIVGCNAANPNKLTALNEDNISSNVVGIADDVFINMDIQTVTLPKNIKYIGDYAFAGNVNLWKFTFPENSVKSIGAYAFYKCGLTNVSLGNGLEKIGNYAFRGNTQLDNNSLSPYNWIPESVNSIGAYAFYNTKLWNTPRGDGNIVYAGNWVVGYLDASTLRTVTLDFDTKRVAGISDYAFSDATSLTSIQGLSNCRYIGKAAFKNCTSLSNVSLNRNLTEISDYAFYDCEELVKVTFPKTVTKIGAYAFYNCKLLESIDLSSTNVSQIDLGAFRDCTNLQEIKLSNKLTEISDLAFYNCVRITNIEIPDSVTYLGKKSFYKCIELRNISLGDGITEILESTFYGCEKLTSIVIPDSVVSIGRRAFYNCESATTLTLGENVEEILDYAFYNDKNVEELKFNDKLKSIGNYAFKGLEKVKTIILPKTITSIGQHAFYGFKEASFYTDAESLLPNWHARLNSSRRPMFYGVTFDEQGRVSSVIVSKDFLVNKNATGGISAPAANFSGWKDENDKVYSMEDIIALEEEIKLYAIYE